MLDPQELVETGVWECEDESLQYIFIGVGLWIWGRGDWVRCEKTGIPDVRYWMVPNEHK